ncbi:hypothetical protein K1W54_05050 [Micromonospora sp. CPCC 205371]|nr:hypothetical protein [Micromonospora sp. CPCC 205371]
MTAPLLSVGDATVWPSIWGGHVVDFGDGPRHFSDRRAAYAEAAVRSKNSGQTSPPSPGTVPGPAVPDPKRPQCGPGTTCFPARPRGAVDAEESAGVTGLPVSVTPAMNVAWPARSRQGVARPGMAGSPT